MSRWIYTLSTVVLSKSTHNHEVAAMYLPWTTVLYWPLARSFDNEEPRTVDYMIHRLTTLCRKHDWTNEQTMWTIPPAELTNGNWISTSNDEIHLWRGADGGKMAANWEANVRRWLFISSTFVSLKPLDILEETVLCSYNQRLSLLPCQNKRKHTIHKIRD